MSSSKNIVVLLFLALPVCTFFIPPAQARQRLEWQRKKVDWRMSADQRIKAINYPPNKIPPMLNQKKNRKSKSISQKILYEPNTSRFEPLVTGPGDIIVANVIDSPPIDGFVPYIAVSVTDERFDELDSIFDAYPQPSVVGNYLTANPQSDYAIGLFDTGASAHVIGNNSANRTGIFDAVPSLVTSNIVEITGVTGSVDAWVSQPLGIFIDGLGAIEPNGMLLDTSGIVGQSNVSVAIGQTRAPNAPDLPTVIGSPMAVYFAAEFRNDFQVTVSYDNNDFTAPDIRLYDLAEPNIPSFTNLINMELRPCGATSVQYIPTIDIFTFEFTPTTPSVIIGNLSQSLFFFPSVDIYEANEMAYDKDGFMFDTGAQVTVIASSIAARLALDIQNPDFTVEIQGVTGDITEAAGFYVDSVEIPALGQWMCFTNVPVVLLDIVSPEGGTLDGIIGTNLMLDYNFVLRGGSLPDYGDHRLEFQLSNSSIIADIAPDGGDGIVDILDMTALTQAWLAVDSPPSANWNPKCDIAPARTDGKVDLLDFTLFALYWLQTTTP